MFMKIIFVESLRKGRKRKMTNIRPSAKELWYLDQIVLATREERAIEQGVKDTKILREGMGHALKS